MQVISNRRESQPTGFVQETRYVDICSHDGTLIRLTCQKRLDDWKVTWVTMDHGERPEVLERAYALALATCSGAQAVGAQ